jgi:hypothetical protein
VGQLVILNFCFATERSALSGRYVIDPSTQQKFDLFIDGRLLFAKLNMLWWLYWSSIAAIDPDFAEVM